MQDLRYGLRLLLKSPGFTLIAVAALAVGIGANVTIFGFVSALVLRPIDGPQSDRLARIDSGEPTFMSFIGYGDYVEYRDRNESLASLAAFYPGWMTAVRIEGPAQMIAVTPVSGNYFETLGITAARGRVLTAEDDAPGATRVVVLSDVGWRRYFEADEAVLGRTITINREAFTVVGVTPPGFKGTVYPNIPQMYAPYHARGVDDDTRTFLIGRLLPGVSRNEAEADLSRIASQLSIERGRRASVSVHPGTTAFPQVIRVLAPLGALFMVVVATVLWLACNNIAVVLLARAEARRREIGIRLAIGASRSRLLRQLLAENLLLSAAGGLGAAGVALATSRWLTQIYLPVPAPIALMFDFDWRVTAFAVGIALAATLLFGLGPAIQSMRTDVVSAVKQGDATPGTRSSRASGSLIVTQVAMSTALLITAGLLVRSLDAPTNLRFDTDGILMATIRLTGSEYTPERIAAFPETVLERLENEPGVVSVTAADSVPLTRNIPLSASDMRAEGDDMASGSDFARRVYTNHVSRGHFRTLGIPLITGRDFSAEDDLESTAVGIVNETLALRFWPGESAIGKRLGAGDGRWVQVIGVASDSTYESPEEDSRAVLYRPLSQEPISTVTFLVKTNLDTRRASSLIRDRVVTIDPNLVVYNLNTLDERIGLGLLANRALGLVSGVLGLLGLVLGAIGTYGIVSFRVEQRRREIGLRIALGAAPSKVVRLATRQGMKWTATGVGLGLVGALAGARLLQSSLRNVSAADPVAIAAAIVLLFATAYAACLVPARRASRTDPMAVLRE